MDSFFGIGPLELIFILIFALIFLGPERLPGAVRQIASFIRQIQNLSSTLSQQLGEEFGDIRDLDPRYQIQQILDEPDEKEKEAAKKAEEKKKADEKKQADAKKAEEKRKADEKKKAEEAKKKAEEAAKLAKAEAAKSAEDTAANAAAEVPVADAGATVTSSPTDTQPAPPIADEQTSPASASVVDQTAKARAAAAALIPKASENSIAPPTHGVEARVNGRGDTAAKSAEDNESALSTVETVVEDAAAEEKQA